MRKMLLLGLMSLSLAGCSRSFTEFSSKEGNFAILMPGTPERKTKYIKGVKHIAFGVSVGEGVFSVGYSDLPSASSFNLTECVTGLAKACGGKVLSDTAWTIGTSAGRQFEAKTTKPMGYLSGRVVVINARYYAILVLGENARLSNPNVRAYFKSFKTIK